jgi:hypothetical protein
MRNVLILICIILGVSSLQKETTLKGTWEFRGSIFNGKYDGAPKDYTLQRKYTAAQYDAFLLEKGEKTVKFESGNYKLKGDTCLETQTFSAQPSKLKGVTVHYWYIVRHDSLILRAKLPNGFVEEDYWKKVK